MRRSALLLVVGLLLATVVLAAPSLATGPTARFGPDAASLPTGNATLELHVSPVSALVAVNGTPVALGGDGSATLHVAPGTYIVTASDAGYSAFSGNVTVGPGASRYLTVHLPSQAASSGGSGGPSTSFLLAIGATIAGAIAIVALVLYVRRTPSSDGGTSADATPVDPVAVGAPKPDEGPE
ncbi:MAG: hypothetical protein L3K00_07695 [Thermoplasmata archaeon]|nr:hypothetical protein [Thermoplasmata archaeon]